MNNKSVIPLTGGHPKIAAGILARLGQIIAVFIIEAVVLFMAAGRLDWAWAWIFLGVYVLSVAINSIFLFRTSPETIAERGKPGEMKDWDKVVSGLWSVAQFILIPLVAGLNVRFGWTGVLSIAWHIVGIIAFTIGLGFFGWAMITNAYFSTVVRIQSERGQTVCRSGPYRLMRHPGYMGTILQSLGIPLLLGSGWALIAGAAAAALIITRTSIEDRTLQKELPGYQDYATEVRDRLVPGVW